MLPSPFHLDNHSHILSFNHFDVPTSLDPDNFSKSPSSLGLHSHSDVQDNHFPLSLEFCQNDIFTENYIFKSSPPIYFPITISPPPAVSSILSSNLP